MFRPGTGCDEICAHCVGVYMSMCLCDGDRRPRAVGNRSARDHCEQTYKQILPSLLYIQHTGDLVKSGGTEILKGYEMKNEKWNIVEILLFS